MRINSKPASNFVELLDRDALCAVLTQCGIESVVGLSDYELFRAFCGVWHLLQGHYLQKKCAHLLKSVFSLSPALSDESCNMVWKTVSQQLFLSNETSEEILQASCNFGENTESGIEQAEDLPHIEAEMLNCHALIRMRAPSWEAWQAQVEETLASNRSEHAAAIYYRLPQRYADCVPNPYLIGKIVPEHRRSEGERNLLHAQILRHLFAHCLREDVPLLLSAPCKVEALEGLLKRLTREIGTPRLICAPRIPDGIFAISTHSARDHRISLGIDLRICSSEAFSAAFLRRVAEQYPLGRLFLIP